MKALEKIASKVPKTALKMSRQTLVLKKNSPHIFFGLGIAGVVGGAILACRATLKLHEEMDYIEADIKAVKAMDEPMGGPSHREVVDVYARSALTLVRLYGSSFVVGGLGIACLSGSHIQMARRNTSLMAAYAAAHRAFEEYRQRVEEELGSERELEIRQGTKEMVNPETGELVQVEGPYGTSEYAVLFDEAAEQWRKNNEYNRLYLHSQQEYANNLLHARGHLFLNEVYDMLGVPRTAAGQMVGWVRGNKDDYVDFKIYETYNERFINGWEPRLWLDFNVDGVVYDLI